MSYLLRAHLALVLLLAAREGRAQPIQPCQPSTNPVARLCELDRPFLEGARRMAVRYPDMLRQAGIEGDVHVRYEVDTAGRPEMRTLQIGSTSHALFAQAVRNAVAGERYRSPRRAGAPVRVRVEAVITFRTPKLQLSRATPHQFGADSSGLLRIRVNGYVPFDSAAAPVLTLIDRTDILVAITQHFIALEKRLQAASASPFQTGTWLPPRW